MMKRQNKAFTVVIFSWLLVITMQQEPTPTYVKQGETITFTCSSPEANTAPTIEVKRTGLRSEDMRADGYNHKEVIAEASGSGCTKKGKAILATTNDRYTCTQVFSNRALKVTFTITNANDADSLIIWCDLKGTETTVGNFAKFIVPTAYTMDFISKGQLISGQARVEETGDFMERSQLMCNVTGWGLNPNATLDGEPHTLDWMVTDYSETGALPSHTRQASFWLKDFTVTEAHNNSKLVCQVRNQETGIDVSKQITLVVISNKTKKQTKTENGDGGASSLEINAVLMLSAMAFLALTLNN